MSNTANTITYTDDGGYPVPSMSFCAGDALEIRRVDHALDQPGRARGSLISGDNPTPPPGGDDQVTEPCYSWNNGQASFSGGPGVRANVHYFNNTPMPGYTPYIYPHPLVNATPPPITPTPTPTATPPATPTPIPSPTPTVSPTPTPTPAPTATPNGRLKRHPHP